MERLWHTWDEWECYPAGFYDDKPRDKSMTDAQAKLAYAAFLSDIDAFETAMDGVLNDWPNSCEHYLSNERMNRIAWLGQSAACYALGIPSAFRAGFYQLSEEQQHAANLAALGKLNKWLTDRGEPELTLETAQSRTEMDLY